MRHARIVLLLVFVGAASNSAAQICAGAPSFSHVTWQSSVGLEFVGSGQRAGTSLVGGRDALFAGALASIGHADADAASSWNVGGIVGSDRVIHRRGRVHLCPTFKILYTIGPDQGAFGASLIDVNSFSMTGAGTIGFVASETVTRQIVPTFSVGFAHDRTWATRANQRVAERTDGFVTANLGLGFVFDDQHAITPQITMAFREPRRITGVLILGTIGFAIR